jgi:hypothetical protein
MVCCTAHVRIRSCYIHFCQCVSALRGGRYNTSCETSNHGRHFPTRCHDVVADRVHFRRDVVLVGLRTVAGGSARECCIATIHFGFTRLSDSSTSNVTLVKLDSR